MTNIAPTIPGFYWAKWKIADEGTVEADELTPSDRWEPVEMIENCTDPSSDEQFKVFVHGVAKVQSPENFFWGPRIPDFKGAAA